ncbi:MAG: hypothetical protein ACJAVS_001389 [Paracoccaceae bacterium]|jgi:hypothetical protein
MVSTGAFFIATRAALPTPRGRAACDPRRRPRAAPGQTGGAAPAAADGRESPLSPWNPP